MKDETSQNGLYEGKLPEEDVKRYILGVMEEFESGRIRYRYSYHGFGSLMSADLIDLDSQKPRNKESHVIRENERVSDESRNQIFFYASPSDEWSSVRDKLKGEVKPFDFLQLSEFEENVEKATIRYYHDPHDGDVFHYDTIELNDFVKSLI